MIDERASENTNSKTNTQSGIFVMLFGILAPAILIGSYLMSSPVGMPSNFLFVYLLIVTGNLLFWMGIKFPKEELLARLFIFGGFLASGFNFIFLQYFDSTWVGKYTASFMILVGLLGGLKHLFFSSNKEEASVIGSESPIQDSSHNDFHSAWDTANKSKPHQSKVDSKKMESSFDRNQSEKKRESVEKPTEKPVGKPGFGTLLFGVALPMGLIAFELSTHAIARTALDPFPSNIHLFLFSLIPISNLLTWFAARVNLLPLYLLTTLSSGMALGIAILYSLLLYPMYPGFMKSMLPYGFLGFAPLFSLIPTLRSGAVISKLSSDARTFFDGHQLKHLGHMIILVMVVAVELPSTLTRMHISQAKYNTKSGQEAIDWLRQWGDRAVLLRACYERSGRATDILGTIYEHQDPVSVSQARSIYYRVTGLAFNTVPIPKSFRSTIRNGGLIDDPARLNAGAVDEFDLDPDIAGESVSGVARGLDVADSQIKAVVDGNANFATLSWTFTFTNNSDVPREARTKILLPSGAVVTKATIWLNDWRRETVIKPRLEARKTYKKAVISHRKDPLLVSVTGKDTVLVQCYPVVKNQLTKIRLNIITPLRFVKKDRSTLTLPTFSERNFGFASSHKVRLSSSSNISMDGLKKETINGKEVNQAELANSILSRFQGVVSVERDPLCFKVFSPNPYSGYKEVYSQKVIKPKKYPKPGKLTVLIDQSITMKRYMDSVVEGLRALPTDIPVTIIGVKDGEVVYAENTIPAHKQYNTALEKLGKATCSGGQSNAASLNKIVSNLKESQSVLWIHGAQPFAPDRDLGFLRRLSGANGSPLLYDLQVASGPNFVLKESYRFSNLVRVSRTNDITGDIKSLFDSWQVPQPSSAFGGEDIEIIVRPKGIKTSFKTTKELSQLIAYQTVLNEYHNHNLMHAYEIANRYHLVTPVSSAVVSDQSEYKRRRKTEINEFKNRKILGDKTKNAELVDEDFDSVDRSSGKDLLTASSSSEAADNKYFAAPKSGGSSRALDSVASVLSFGRMAQKEAELERKKMDLESKMNARGKVVYSLVDIPEGSIVNSADLEEKEIEQSKIPMDALTSSSLAAGRVSKYGISAGQIVSQHDISSNRMKTKVLPKSKNISHEKQMKLHKTSPISFNSSRWKEAKFPAVSTRGKSMFYNATRQKMLHDLFAKHPLIGKSKYYIEVLLGPLESNLGAGNAEGYKLAYSDSTGFVILKLKFKNGRVDSYSIESYKP